MAAPASGPPTRKSQRRRCTVSWPAAPSFRASAKPSFTGREPTSSAGCTTGCISRRWRSRRRRSASLPCSACDRGIERPRPAGSFREVVDLEQEAAAVRFERPVHRAGRAAGIGAGREILAALAVHVVADRQIALDQVNLFPIFVHERRGGVDAGREAQQPGAAAALGGLVERAGEGLLPDAVGRTIGGPPVAGPGEPTTVARSTV